MTPVVWGRGNPVVSPAAPASAAVAATIWDEGERDGVAAGCKPLHQRDLEREEGGASEHEQVAGDRAAVDSGENGEPEHREADADPACASDRRAEQGDRDQWREDDGDAR